MSDDEQVDDDSGAEDEAAEDRDGETETRVDGGDDDLVDDDDEPTSELDSGTRTPSERTDDRLTYDCSDWAGESRSLLDAMLTSADIRHAWIGTVLDVSPEDEERVDAVIDEVMAAADASLDPQLDKVVYEVATWSSALQSSLAQSLAIAEVAYEWDEHGDLVVYAEDEERVEEIFEALPDPDDPDLVGDDGIEVQDQLSRLFVAAGHLAKRPNDADSVVAAAEVGDRIEQISVPFGFEPAVWRNIVNRTGELRDALTELDPDEQLDDDELMQRASDLRDLLRLYV